VVAAKAILRLVQAVGQAQVPRLHVRRRARPDCRAQDVGQRGPSSAVSTQQSRRNARDRDDKPGQEELPSSLPAPPGRRDTRGHGHGQDLAHAHAVAADSVRRRARHAVAMDVFRRCALFAQSQGRLLTVLVLTHGPTFLPSRMA